MPQSPSETPQAQRRYVDWAGVQTQVNRFMATDNPDFLVEAIEAFAPALRKWAKRHAKKTGMNARDVFQDVLTEWIGTIRKRQTLSRALDAQVQIKNAIKTVRALNTKLAESGGVNFDDGPSVRHAVEPQADLPEQFATDPEPGWRVGLADEIKRNIETLPIEEREVVVYKNGLNGDPPLTNRGINRQTGIPEFRVPLLERSAISRLRHKQRMGEFETERFDEQLPIDMGDWEWTRRSETRSLPSTIRPHAAQTSAIG